MTSRGLNGFSLIELMVTVALIAVLSAMLYNSTGLRHARDRRQLCADNLEKLYLALQLYAGDQHDELPAVTNAITAEEPLNLLVPKDTADTSLFTCPGGRDAGFPSGDPLTRHRISYAYYMGRRLAAAGDGLPVALLTDRQVNTEAKRAGELMFSPDGHGPGNNHGRLGGNLLLRDGSVRSSGPELDFTVGVPPGVTLLNPKP